MFIYQVEKDKEKKAERNKIIQFTKTRFEQEAYDYNIYIKTQFQYLDFTGLNSILQRPIPLEDIYVKLKVITASASEPTKENEKESDENSFIKAETLVDSLEHLFESRLKIRTPVRILILGHPGSGKTTLMKWIALQCQYPHSRLLYSHIPIYISLKDFGKNPDETYRKNSLKDISIRNLRNNNIDTGFLNDSFSSNKVLFLLDGLDEVADETIRRELIEWIQKQNILRSLLIITSRYSGIQASKGITFNSSVNIYEIQNFTKPDIALFLKNWYKNIELSVNKIEDSEFAYKQAEEKSKDLIDVINGPNHRSLASLAINPLLLTIIALVHRTRAILPKERHKLYEEAIKVMVELWNISNKKLEMNFNFDNSITNISTIAQYLMKQNTKELTEREIINLLPSRIENKPLDVFLNEMILKSGLLYSSEGKFGFLHLTFQEYLAARFFAKSEDQNAILNYINEDFWIETIKLFVNIGNTHLFFAELIAQVRNGKYKKINFLIELAQEIVVEEDKQKYVGQIFTILLPNLLELENNTNDDKKVFEIFYPSIEVYLNYPNKSEEFFWNVFEKAKNDFARSISIILLFSFKNECQKKLVEQLKAEIANIESKFFEIRQSYDNIEKNKKKINVKDAKRSNLEREAELENYISRIFYNVFCAFAFYTRNIDDFEYLVNMLNSKVRIFRFFATIALRDYEDVKPLCLNYQIKQLAIIKPLQDAMYLKDKKADEIAKAPNVITPSKISDILIESFSFSWRDLRPIWQIEQMIGHFNNYRSVIDKYESKSNNVAKRMKAKLYQLNEDERDQIFIN